MTRSLAGAIAAVAFTALAACGSGHDRPESQVYVADVADVTAVVPLPNGGVRVARRAAGVVEDVTPDGTTPARIANVDVRSDGQRGLLGLAIDDAGRTFASWTRPDGRLVVGRVAPGPARLVWLGPASADLANGGHLELRDGRLLVGIGDLLHNDLVDDPGTLNGKLLALDPDGEPDQEPAIVSAGWNNPFAFTVLDDGAIWVADNSPGDTGERLVRGDVADPVAVELPEATAPAGIAYLGDQLVVCGYKSGALLAYRLIDGEPRERRTLATGCTTAVAALGDGRVVYASADDLRVLTP